MENRRWKLKRKFPVPAEFLEPAYLLREYEGKEIFLGKSTHGNDLCISIHCGYYFPISWLTEIKEPLTVGDAWEGEDCSGLSIFGVYKKGWNAALENQKLGQIVDENTDDEKFDNTMCRMYSDNCHGDEFGYSCMHDLWKNALKYARRTP